MTLMTRIFTDIKNLRQSVLSASSAFYSSAMKLGKVIGRVVSTQKMHYFDGLKLLLVQPINEHHQHTGLPFVAFDAAQAGEGDTVFYETSKEAGWALREWFMPGDAAIIGIVDQIDAGGTAQ